jgi:hypothetical protein
MSPQEITSPPAKVIRPKTIQPATGVKIEPAPHKANRIHMWEEPLTTSEEIIKKSCQREYNLLSPNGLIETSFEDMNGAFAPASHGFVDAAVRAYNEHHHLIIRPEDVWFSILIQINTLVQPQCLSSLRFLTRI